MPAIRVTIAGRCAEKKISARTIILSGLAFGGLPYCPSELAATIFHEVMHLAEGWNLLHGNLSDDCGEACFPGSDELKRGDASRCGNESGLVPFAGVSAGAAFPGKGSPTGYARLYVGVESAGLILSIFRPALGIGLSIIGEPTGAEPGGASPGTSTLLSLMGALRFDPGKDGGVYFSIGGGSGLVFGSGGVHRGYEVGAKLGYRWHIYDISLDAGMNYDPTRDAGQEKLIPSARPSNSRRKYVSGRREAADQRTLAACSSDADASGPPAGHPNQDAHRPRPRSARARSGPDCR